MKLFEGLNLICGMCNTYLLMGFIMTMIGTREGSRERKVHVCLSLTACLMSYLGNSSNLDPAHCEVAIPQ